MSKSGQAAYRAEFEPWNLTPAERAFASQPGRPEDVFSTATQEEANSTGCDWCMEPTEQFFVIPDIIPGRPEIVDRVCRPCAVREIAELHLPPEERGSGA